MANFQIRRGGMPETGQDNSDIKLMKSNIHHPKSGETKGCGSVSIEIGWTSMTGN